MAESASKFFFGYFILFCLFGFVLLGAPMPKYDEQKCDSLSVDTCFKDLQVFLKLTSLPFTSKSNELDKFCERCLRGYNCSQNLMANEECLTEENKKLVKVYVSMAQYTHFMLCGDGTSTETPYLRDKYLEYSHCIQRHDEELKCCAKETHIPDLPVLKIMQESGRNLPEMQISNCCPVSRFIQCASDVAMQCGDGAANLTEHYIRRAAGEEVQKLCQELPKYPELDSRICPEPVPTCSGSFILYFDKTVLFITLTFLIWRMHL